MRKSSRHLLLSAMMTAAISIAAPALAQSADKPATQPETTTQAAPAVRQKPRLILALSVDQLSADLFAQYRQRFTDGFARLLTGAVFPSGFQSHAATETCPGHSTLLTGVHPSRSGIIANNWTVPGIARADKEVYCAEDETDPESTSRKPVVSPKHLKAPTLGDLMKQADPRSLNVAVSAKDRAAVMMSGHNADAAYWWLGKGFTTYKGRTISEAVQAENKEAAALIDAGAPALPLPDGCTTFDRAVPVGNFTIGQFRFPLKAGDASGFNRSPRVDTATGALAIRLVDEMGLGRDDVPDVLSVSFSATDYVGHAFGNEGAEMCIQLANLDKTIGTLLAELDKRGIDYAVALSADHGGIDAPERGNEQAYPAAQRMSADLREKELSDAVSKDTGISVKDGPLLFVAGGSGDIWLNAELSKKQRSKVISATVARLKAHPQIEAAYTTEELAKMPVPSGNPQDWTMEQRVRASFDPERSGEILMMTKRGVVPGDPRPGYTATHGSPWDYDRRVPMLFWRKGVAGFEQPAPVETVDIAPTLAALVGLKEPTGTWDGRCLDIDGTAADTCGS